MGLAVWQVENCADMFADGDTIPFISRYRKEKTGGLDDAQVAELKHYIDIYNELDKRKDTILKTIAEAGALSDGLVQNLTESSGDALVLLLRCGGCESTTAPDGRLLLPRTRGDRHEVQLVLFLFIHFLLF